jgi:hypothetical protein
MLQWKAIGDSNQRRPDLLALALIIPSSNQRMLTGIGTFRSFLAGTHALLNTMERYDARTKFFVVVKSGRQVR